MSSYDIKKEFGDMNEAPILASNKIYYNCSKCSSAIEIISINEDTIEFKCNNNHNEKMCIKEYLEKMRKNNDNKINNGICSTHKDDYLVYCFECNEHLCKDCLKLGGHSYHYKINIIEILPKDESLTKINNVINENKIKIKKLNATKIKTENKLNNVLNNNINKINQIEANKKYNYEKAEKKELSLNNYYYHLEIKKLKEEYEAKIKNVKMNYKKNISDIKNKYKIINNKSQNIFNSKINELKNKIKLKIESYKFKEQIDKASYFNELMEIIYNTYRNYNNNYYNAININNVYNSYFKIDNKIKINKLEEKESLIKNYEVKV